MQQKYIYYKLMLKNLNHENCSIVPEGYNVDATSERSSEGHDMLGLKELWDLLLQSGMGSYSIFLRLKMSSFPSVVMNLKAPSISSMKHIKS